MGIKLTEQRALQLIEDDLLKYVGIKLKDASINDFYKALANICHDILLEKREKYHARVVKAPAKRMHYFIMLSE